MSNKLTLRALALAGIFAISALPALAQNMAPATLAPGAAGETSTKADVKADAQKSHAAKAADSTVKKKQVAGATKDESAAKAAVKTPSNP